MPLDKPDCASIHCLRHSFHRSSSLLSDFHFSPIVASLPLNLEAVGVDLLYTTVVWSLWYPYFPHEVAVSEVPLVQARKGPSTVAALKTCYQEY